MTSPAIHLASIMGLRLPPSIALLLTIGFIIFLFRRDFRERPHVTRALWLPVIWMVVIGSRSPVQWLSLGGFVHGASVEEGNPLDAFIYFLLIVAGFWILNQRQVSLGEVFRNNGWLIAFLLYCFIAIAWSDYPFVSFKRWIKILGHPIMVLILLTEPDPQEAIERLMKRSAYVLIPMSILLIKYYPEIGRGFDSWTGAAMNNGINTSKNELGWMCLVLGLFFFWRLLEILKSDKSKARRNELLLTGGFLYMIWWLLLKSDSSTSLLCLLLGMSIVGLFGLRRVTKGAVTFYIALAVGILVIGQVTFGLLTYVISLTGHANTLAGRGELWRELLALRTNPIFGVGFDSFWLGDRLKTLAASHWWAPNEAHNGYLETYLNLGVIGLAILIGIIISTYRKVRFDVSTNFQFASYRLGFLAAIVVLNWTEALFKGLSPVWFVFYVIAMDYPVTELTWSDELIEDEMTYDPDATSISTPPSTLEEHGFSGKR